MAEPPTQGRQIAQTVAQRGIAALGSRRRGRSSAPCRSRRRQAAASGPSPRSPRSRPPAGSRALEVRPSGSRRVATSSSNPARSFPSLRFAFLEHLQLPRVGNRHAAPPRPLDGECRVADAMRAADARHRDAGRVLHHDADPCGRPTTCSCSARPHPERGPAPSERLAGGKATGQRSRGARPSARVGRTGPAGLGGMQPGAIAPADLLRPPASRARASWTSPRKPGPTRRGGRGGASRSRRCPGLPRDVRSRAIRRRTRPCSRVLTWSSMRPRTAPRSARRAVSRCSELPCATAHVTHADHAPHHRQARPPYPAQPTRRLSFGA